MAASDEAARLGAGVVVLNPVSGAGDHAGAVRDHAADRGYDVVETEAEGDAVDLAREAAADGAPVVAAAGGDGTLNEVVRGLREAPEDATVGVVPCGTGNDFAGNIGVHNVEHAFEVLDGGERRDVDLGLAGDRPFLNSCVSGPTAEASGETDAEQKSRLGTAAYVLNTLRMLPTYEGIRSDVTLEDGDGEAVWTGEAIAVLVGNGRHFPPTGSTQGDLEDGRFDVTLVHGVGSIDLMGSAAIERVLGRGTSRTTRYQVPTVRVRVQSGDPISFSLDGEIVQTDELTMRTDPGAVRLAVGSEYDPIPERQVEG